MSDLVDFLKQGKQVQTFPEYGKTDITGIQVINNIRADVIRQPASQERPTSSVGNAAAVAALI